MGKLEINGDPEISKPDTDEVENKNIDDPWELPELKVKSTPWSELSVAGKIWRVTWVILRFALLLAFLYLFICSLDFLGTAFKLLGGKTAGKAFRETDLLNNPIAGLMIGVLVTVLVQSSSTSTSIIITMVGAGLLNVAQAIYIVMGANIGTTVTNTIVSLAQAKEKNEFRRAFGAATVHDMFNWLTVLILLPVEAASGVLQKVTNAIVKSMHLQTQEEANKDLLQVITKPFTKLIIKIDKKVIENVAKAKTDEALEAALSKDILVTFCKKDGPLQNVTREVDIPCDYDMTTIGGINSTFVTDVNNTFINNTTTMSACTMLKNITTLEPEVIKYRCHTLFSQGNGDFKLSDGAAGAILLIVAIAILCICLFFIVKILHSMLQGPIALIIRKFLNNNFPGYLAWLTGYVAILIGAGLTILVQSSSIFTSALTPLVGVGVIKMERMYPLTLGSNIGTTTTGILAALAADGSKLALTLQLAFCHLFFNIFGIIIWYPVPVMRKVPLRLAKFLGNTTADYKWFAIVYLLAMFFIFPAAIFGISLLGWYVLVAVGVPILVIAILIIVINVMQSKCPRCLPKKMRNWEWLPLPLRSLKPLDDFFRRFCCRCRCCSSVCLDISSGETEEVVMPQCDLSSKGQTNIAYEYENSPTPKIEKSYAF